MREQGELVMGKGKAKAKQMKETAGRATSNRQMEAEGSAEKASGKAQEAVEQARKNAQGH
ncbi:CsbD family protein [Streptomyces populi]